MTQVTHHLCGKSVKGNVENTSVLLTNNYGSFLHLADKPLSKYHGFFAHEPTESKYQDHYMFKILEHIERSGATTVIENDYHSVTQVRGGVAETFFVPLEQEALVYELSKPSSFEAIFDVRHIYDERSMGRYYTIFNRDDVTVVKFTKRTNNAEDDSHDEEEFTVFIAIAHNGSLTKNEKWVKRNYEQDAARGTDAERYVFNAATIKASKCVFGVAANEHDAISRARYSFRHANRMKKERRLYVNACSDGVERAASYLSLNSLVIPKGIFAGLPWFFQVWSRDQFISLGTVHRYLQKAIIMKYIHQINENGRIPNVKGSSLASADGVGWLFLRAEQLYDKNVFKAAEKKQIIEALELSLQRLQEKCFKEGLNFSAFNESWMDTSYNDGGREGFPIEIQALTLAQFRFLHKLTGLPTVKEDETKLAKLVKKTFWNTKYLADLKDDFTIRPNVFLAAYAYPELLSKKEWTVCFETVLPALWCEWGGLASIDKNHHLFQPNYTGQDNKSYHRGDSWYWINNIAAIVMHRTNPARFSKYIAAIKSASVKDLFWLGAVGHCSEVSSADKQTASGCLAQAWSAATLIELIQELEAATTAKL